MRSCCAPSKASNLTGVPARGAKPETEPCDLEQVRLLVVSGPSGVGKGTVVAALAAARDDVDVAVSATTRPPRAGEVDGVHYHFLDDRAFDELARAGGFLERTVYNGYHYGTLWASVRNALAEGRTLVLEIDVQGALQVRDRFSDAVLVFLLPPSLSVLEARMRGRGTDDKATMARRVALAQEELALAGAFDYRVTNAQVDQAVADLGRIVDAHCVKRR